MFPHSGLPPRGGIGSLVAARASNVQIILVKRNRRVPVRKSGGRRTPQKL